MLEHKSHESPIPTPLRPTYACQPLSSLSKVLIVHAVGFEQYPFWIPDDRLTTSKHSSLQAIYSDYTPTPLQRCTDCTLRGHFFRTDDFQAASGRKNNPINQVIRVIRALRRCGRWAT